MNVPNIIIAVDGYSSTGKSTFAKLLAKELGFLYLDSGALYRGVTLFALENGYFAEDGVNFSDFSGELKGLDLHFGEGGKLYMDTRCIEEEIRSMRISSHVSPISAASYVREFVDEKLHYLARDGRVVMDGRDIGTTVFPNAQIKIFMTASESVRVQRRYDEMVAKGQSPLMEDVLKNLRERDYIDSHREISPLSRAEDSYLLDNSDMTLKEELEWAKGLIRGRFVIYD